MGHGADSVSLTTAFCESTRRIWRSARLLPASLTALVAIAAGVGAVPAQAEPMPNGVPGNWALALNEEFSANGLNTALWTPEWPSGAMSGQCTSPSLVSQPGNGYLYLEVRGQESTCSGIKNADTGSLVESDPADGKPGHSGFLYSYGYVEWHVYVVGWGGEEQGCPKGGCVPDWPALWSFPENEENEIDTMEGLHGKVCHTWHHHVSPIEETQGCQSGSYAGWHTYGVDWEPGVLKFYYDGVQVGEVNAGYINSTPQYLIMDDVPPGSYGGKLVVPDEIIVDYVRVWQHPKPPTAATGGWSNLGATQATVNGTINPNGAETDYLFEYGETTAYGHYSSDGKLGVGWNGTPVNETLAGLAEGTTYHYRLVASNSQGAAPNGSDGTFTTEQRPTVTTNAASSIAEGQATLNGTVNPHGLETEYYFQYGETTFYGEMTPEIGGGAGSSTEPVSATPTNLRPATIYHYRLVATSAAGTSYGPDETFRTVAAPSMMVANGKVEAITGDIHSSLYRTTSDFVQNTWQSALLGAAGTIDSAPSSVADSSGDIWTAFEGAGNQLWVGVDTPGGGWGMSYEGPSSTTYSAPSAVIDSSGNIWVGAEGSSNTLAVTVRSKTTGTWEVSFQGG